MPKIIIIDKPYGQLGNAIYKFGNIVAFCIENKINLIDFSMLINGYSKHFPNICNRIFLSFPYSISSPINCWIVHRMQLNITRFIRSLNIINIHRNFSGEQAFLHDLISSSENKLLILRGYPYNADECVRKHGDYIRKLFRPRHFVIKKAQKRYKQLSKQIDYLIGVHIRHSDYKKYKNGNYFFDEEYFAAVMKKVESLFSGNKIKFIIFTDSNKLKLSAFAKFDFHYLDTEKSIIFDWYMMSLTDYIIGPAFSTYSGWASFYGKKPIFRLNGRNYPRSISDFKFDEVLNNSDQYLGTR